MASPFELPELPETRLSPQLLVGVASPLWGYFGAAAAGGVAYWWMTRWTQPVNLEALFGKAAALPAAGLEAAAEPVAATVEAAAEAVEPAADPLPEIPVGGESGPISPLIETLAAPEAPVEAEPEAVAAPEPEMAAQVAPEPAVVTPPEAEATAEPIPDPVAKPRIRKTPPANGLEP